MTSNIGSQVIEKGGKSLGFQLSTDNQEERSYQRIRSLVLEEMRNYFKPEFLNRLDEIIVFRQLTKAEVKEKFKDRLVDEGYNPAYGARPLRRAIMRLME